MQPKVAPSSSQIVPFLPILSFKTISKVNAEHVQERKKEKYIYTSVKTVRLLLLAWL